jgi:proteasome lid subunit RPN8/RPN11
MNPLSFGIYLTPSHWKQMESDVNERLPEEACGLVAGSVDHSRSIIPITNILHDANRFRLDPDEELKAFMYIENEGWDILAIYHSHPRGIDHPSSTDIDELTFPDIIYLIWYQTDNRWACRGYLMQRGSQVSEVPVIITPVKQL